MLSHVGRETRPCVDPDFCERNVSSRRSSVSSVPVVHLPLHIPVRCRCYARKRTEATQPVVGRSRHPHNSLSLPPPLVKPSVHHCLLRPFSLLLLLHTNRNSTFIFFRLIFFFLRGFVAFFAVFLQTFSPPPRCCCCVYVCVWACVGVLPLFECSLFSFPLLKPPSPFPDIHQHVHKSIDKRTQRGRDARIHAQDQDENAHTRTHTHIYIYELGEGSRDRDR